MINFQKMQNKKTKKKEEEVKGITTNSTNPCFILAMFRTCFLSPFSSFTMKKLQVLQEANHNSQ